MSYNNPNRNDSAEREWLDHEYQPFCTYCDDYDYDPDDSESDSDYT